MVSVVNSHHQRSAAMCERYVGLVRVSTDRQGESGLGLEAGLADVEQYARNNGAELVTVLREVESGTHDDSVDRPTLLRALKLCKKHNACLLVPKIDRLARSTIVYSDVKKSGVRVRAVDNPHADEFTLDILVAVAAQEGRAIRDRTKKALAAYKARGGLLGANLVGCHLTDEGRDRGREKVNAAKKKAAAEAYAELLPDMKRWYRDGLTLRAIADRLNAREDDNTTREAAKWTHVQVKRVLNRAGVDTTRKATD
jgi:DNA invertase Pin-like site-specific DNA recombinase